MLLLSSRAGASRMLVYSIAATTQCKLGRIRLRAVAESTIATSCHQTVLCCTASLTTLLWHCPAVLDPLITAALKDAVQSLQQGKQQGVGAWSETVRALVVPRSCMSASLLYTHFVLAQHVACYRT